MQTVHPAAALACLGDGCGGRAAATLLVGCLKRQHSGNGKFRGLAGGLAGGGIVGKGIAAGRQAGRQKGAGAGARQTGGCKVNGGTLCVCGCAGEPRQCELSVGASSSRHYIYNAPHALT